MSLLVYGAVLFLLSSPLVVLSNSVLNRVEVVRHNGSHPKADAFSNPSCKQRYCKLQGTYCYTDCCKCQCSNDKANYIVNEWKCFSRIELDKMNSTNCTYSIRKPEEPLLGLPLTEVMVQKVSFTNEDTHKTLILCNESIQISWEYRDAFGKWKNGEGNIFNVEVEIEPNPNVPSRRDKRVIKALEWSGKLRSDYAGLLIRFLFKCEGKLQGCALAKISGEHTYDPKKLSTARPPPVIPTTTESPPTTRIPETTTKTPLETKTNNQDDSKNKAAASINASAIFGPILGVLGLICIIGVVCVVVVKYRKRNGQDHETNSVSKLEVYQDPIYADINKGDFANPAYIRASLGPLPMIPGSESTYEPLDSLTRASPDYDNPVNGGKPEVDYDNPPLGMQENNDYDNPPFKGGMENTGDYDNPPLKGEAENNQDYDNPPAKNDYDTSTTDNSQSEAAEDTSF